MLGGTQGGKWAAAINSQLISAGADPRNTLRISGEVASLGFARSQLSATLGQFLTSTGVAPETAYTAVGQYRIQTQAQVGQIQNAVNIAQNYGYAGGQMAMTQAFSGLQPYQGAMLNQVSPQLYRAGLTNMDISAIAPQFSGWSAQQAFMFQQAASGNLRALSYISWNGIGAGQAPPLATQVPPAFNPPASQQTYETLPSLAEQFTPAPGALVSTGPTETRFKDIVPTYNPFDLTGSSAFGGQGVPVGTYVPNTSPITGLLESLLGTPEPSQPKITTQPVIAKGTTVPYTTSVGPYLSPMELLARGPEGPGATAPASTGSHRANHHPPVQPNHMGHASTAATCACCGYRHGQHGLALLRPGR